MHLGKYTNYRWWFPLCYKHMYIYIHMSTFFTPISPQGDDGIWRLRILFSHGGRFNRFNNHHLHLSSKLWSLWYTTQRGPGWNISIYGAVFDMRITQTASTDDGSEILSPPGLVLKLANNETLRIQICPKKGISILLWGWDVSTINPTRSGRGLAS